MLESCWEANFSLDLGYYRTGARSHIWTNALDLARFRAMKSPAWYSGQNASFLCLPVLQWSCLHESWLQRLTGGQHANSVLGFRSHYLWCRLREGTFLQNPHVSYRHSSMACRTHIYCPYLECLVSGPGAVPPPPSTSFLFLAEFPALGSW